MKFKIKFLSLLTCLTIIFAQFNIIFASDKYTNNSSDTIQSTSNNDIVVWDKPPSHWYQRVYRYSINCLMKAPIYLTAQILVAKVFGYLVDIITQKSPDNNKENPATHNRNFSFMWGKLNFSISLQST